MKIYDISVNINKNMTVYKNRDKKRPEIINQANYKTHDLYESRIALDLHTGTHIDAPLHMIKDGDKINDYPLSSFITEAKVIDLTHLKDKITKKDLENHSINEGDFLLFKTKNSFHRGFDFKFVYLDRDGAQFLQDKKIKGVGIDALGIERDQKDHLTHIRLLSAGIIIIEGINLMDVNPGTYKLIALPLKIDDVEASPTRAVLIENKSI